MWHSIYIFYLYYIFQNTRNVICQNKHTKEYVNALLKNKVKIYNEQLKCVLDLQKSQNISFRIIKLFINVYLNICK